MGQDSVSEGITIKRYGDFEITQKLWKYIKISNECKIYFPLATFSGLARPRKIMEIWRQMESEQATKQLECNLSIVTETAKWMKLNAIWCRFVQLNEKQSNFRKLTFDLRFILQRVSVRTSVRQFHDLFLRFSPKAHDLVIDSKSTFRGRFEVDIWRKEGICACGCVYLEVWRFRIGPLNGQTTSSSRLRR